MSKMKVINIDEETHKKLKMISAEHGVTIREFVEEMVSDCNVVHVIYKIKNDDYS